MQVAPGDLRTDVLTENQHAARAGLYAQSMGAYVQYVAANYDQVQAAFQDGVLSARSRATKVHSRTPGIVADLQVGLELFLDFAVTVGAIPETRRDELADRCWTALNHVAKEQRVPQEASEPAHRFLDLARAALAAGRAHVSSIWGYAPKNPEFWGWRIEGAGENQRWVPKGQCIGWTDLTHLYLEPTAAFVTVQAFARDTGEALAVSETTLWKRLKEKGLLASVDAARQTNTIRKTILGAQRKVVHLSVSALTGDVGFSGPDVGSKSGFSETPDEGLSNGISSLQADVGDVGPKTDAEGLQENSAQLELDMETLEL